MSTALRHIIGLLSVLLITCIGTVLWSQFGMPHPFEVLTIMIVATAAVLWVAWLRPLRSRPHQGAEST